MIAYDYKGVKISAVSELREFSFKLDYRTVKQLHKVTRVRVSFFDYFVLGENLTDLAFVKSCIQFFTQSYWRHRHKQGSKIDFSKGLTKAATAGKSYALYFTARQKNNQHYLHLELLKGEDLVSEEYLDPQEVMMLDAAIGKAMNMLSPKLVQPV